MAEEEKKKHVEEQEEVTLVRILGKDVRGDKKLALGLTKISGISWSFANAICSVLELDGNVKVQEVPQKDLERIEEFMKNPSVPQATGIPQQLELKVPLQLLQK